MTVLDLRAPRNLASRRARAYWTVRALPGWLLLGGIEAVALSGLDPAWLRVSIWSATAALALAHLAVMPQWRYRVHRWEVGDEAVYTQAGWFTQERRIAPIARVQTVDLKRGPVEQLFRLANVTVTTASAKGPLAVHALDVATAEQLVTLLTERAQLQGGDGT